MFVILSITQYLRNFNLQISHDHICRSVSFSKVFILEPVKSSKSLRLNFYVVLHSATRSSRSEMFFKIGIPKNFAKFTGKHLCQSHFFDKVAGLRTAILLRKRPWRWWFLVNFANFLRTPFFLEHLRWLLLCNSTEYE